MVKFREFADVKALRLLSFGGSYRNALYYVKFIYKIGRANRIYRPAY